jgi:serine/threonine protein kinase
MWVPPGYTFTRALGAARAATTTCLATRDVDGCAVVLRTARRASRLPEPVLRARHELEILRACAGPGVPEVLELVEADDAAVLVRRYVPGMALDAWVAHEPSRLAEYLEVACQLAEILVRVHAAQVLQLSLAPRGICLEADKVQVHVVDFALARFINDETLADTGAPPPHISDGALPYTAPEQTGRMGRSVDARSDLYALGATLYHVATGHPPFPGSDRLSLLHAHMERTPTAPVEVRPELGAALSRILQRLLLKQPEDRYSTAQSLLADLRSCQTQLESHGAIDDTLPVGTGGVPNRPRFSRIVYDRDRESGIIERALVRASAGHLQTLLVRGEPGSGKSALVEAARAPAARLGARVALGKFESYRDRPYLGWTAALTSFAQQLLRERDDRVARWRAELSAALGGIARALVDCVPELACVLPDAAPVPPLGPREAQARLALAVTRFVCACATREHPLVLVFDDLQWADAGSRALLRELLAKDWPLAALVIGVYRSGDASLDDDLTELFTRGHERREVPMRIDVPPLSQAGCARMLADALERSLDDTFRLAQIVVRKTGGSPLLVRQLIECAHERGLLGYRPSFGWTWNGAALAAAELPEEALPLVMERMEHLPPGAREVLGLASCIGDVLDRTLLAALRAGGSAGLDADIRTLYDTGLIHESEAGLRFAHDRVREAGQALLSEAQRAEIHFAIGRTLLQSVPRAKWPERALELADHVDRGLSLLPPELRQTAIEVNLLAARRALAAGAPASAARYLTVGRELLTEDDWRERRAVGFELHLASAETAFLTHAPDAALALLDALEARDPSPLELANVAIKRLQVYALLRPPEECVRYMVSVLRRLGVRWPLRPSRLRVKLALLRVRGMLRRRGGGGGFRPARAPDRRWAPSLLVLGSAGSTLVRHDAYLPALVSTLVMRRILREGYLTRPGFSLAAYALWSFLILQDPDDARRLGDDALALDQRVPDPIYGPRTRFVVHALLHPWLMRRRQALAPVGRIFEEIRETGDTEYSYYCRFVFSMYSAFAGDPLRSTEERLCELVSEVARTTHVYPAPSRCLEAFAVLRAEAPVDLDERVAVCEPLIRADPSGEPYARTAWVIALCVLDRHDLAFAQSEALGERLFHVSPFVHVADHQLHRGIAAAALAGTERTRRRHYVRTLRACRRRLHRWSRGGPDFQHMVWLLDAEHARLAGRVPKARSLYYRAARRAAEQGFTHHVAIAHERCARMLREANRDTEADHALAEAIARYREWGAIAKLQALTRERSAPSG